MEAVFESSFQCMIQFVYLTNLSQQKNEKIFLSEKMSSWSCAFDQCLSC